MLLASTHIIFHHCQLHFPHRKNKNITVSNESRSSPTGRRLIRDGNPMQSVSKNLSRKRSAKMGFKRSHTTEARHFYGRDTSFRQVCLCFNSCPLRWVMSQQQDLVWEGTRADWLWAAVAQETARK